MLIIHDTRPDRFDDLSRSLDEIVREGARKMLLLALDAEVEEYLDASRDARDAYGHALVVRNGRTRPRKVYLRNAHVEVAAPRVNDRRVGADGRRRKFTSKLLPPYVRRPTRLVEILPLLYLHELTRGDLRQALLGLGGDEAGALTGALIERMVTSWEGEQRRFCGCSLAGRDDLCHWIDGIRIRLVAERLSILLVMGLRPDGARELIATAQGERDSPAAWSTLLHRLRERGLPSPLVVVGDPALGFWSAAREAWPETHASHCPDSHLARLAEHLPAAFEPQLEAARGAIRHGARERRPRVAAWPDKDRQLA